MSAAKIRVEANPPRIPGGAGVRLALMLVAGLSVARQAPAAVAEYSNSWILPAYAAGQSTQLNIDDTLTPPVATFFPPMAGWCLGKIAKVGLPLVHDLGNPAPPIRFLVNESLNGIVRPEHVRICLSGYTAISPDHDARSVQIVNMTQTQAGEISTLRSEVGGVSAKLQSIGGELSAANSEVSRVRGQLSELRNQIAVALKQKAETEEQLGQATQRVSTLEAENAALRNALESARQPQP
jgi:hypothetical protein